MILYDIGNTNVHRYEKGAISKYTHKKFKQERLPDKKFYYISVKNELDERFILSRYAINITDELALDTQYVGLGVDRIAACLGANDGIIIDAGSAITIDIMSNGIHLGGYIMPGLAALRHAFSNISPVLDMEINPSVDLTVFPQNTRDAMSQGVIKQLILFIDSIKKDKTIYFTGGDGKFLSKFFDKTIYDTSLVFKGMQNTVLAKGL